MQNFNKIRQQTACFTGHRQLAEPVPVIERRVSELIEKLIQQGYRYFGAGGARGFDALASESVLKLKAKYPGIRLILVLPFDDQYTCERNWKPAEIEQYHRLKAQAAKIVKIAPGYHSGVYYERNRHLVDYSSVCIAYLRRTNSGTGYTVNYAEKNGLTVLNLAGG